MFSTSVFWLVPPVGKAALLEALFRAQVLRGISGGQQQGRVDGPFWLDAGRQPLVGFCGDAAATPDDVTSNSMPAIRAPNQKRLTDFTA